LTALYHILEKSVATGKVRFVFCDPDGSTAQGDIERNRQPNPESKISLKMEIDDALAKVHPSGMTFVWMEPVPSNYHQDKHPVMPHSDFKHSIRSGSWEPCTRGNARLLWNLLLKQEWNIALLNATAPFPPLQGRRSYRSPTNAPIDPSFP
jgi:hypothetical protein